MYFQNQSAIISQKPTEDDTILKLDAGAESFYGLFNDSSTSWQMLNAHLSPASLQQSPPCGSNSLVNGGSYILASPVKPISCLSQPVMLSDLADCSPHDSLGHGSTLCAYVSYDNRRCTTVVNKMNKLCNLHGQQSSISKKTFSRLLSSPPPSSIQTDVGYTGLQEINCVKPQQLFADHIKPSIVKMDKILSRTIDVPDKIVTTQENGLTIKNGLASRNVLSTTVLNGKTNNIVLPAPLNHKKFTKSASTNQASTAKKSQAKTIVLDEASLKMLLSIMSSKHKSLTSQQHSFLRSLDITLNQTSADNHATVTSKTSSVKIESNNLAQSPCTLQSKEYPIVTSLKPIVCDRDGVPTKCSLKRKLDQTKQYVVTKKTKKSPAFMKPVSHVNTLSKNNANKSASTIFKSVLVDIPQNKFPNLLLISPTMSPAIKEYITLHNNHLLTNHNFFNECPHNSMKNNVSSSSTNLTYSMLSTVKAKRNCLKHNHDCYNQRQPVNENIHLNSTENSCLQKEINLPSAVCKIYQNKTKKCLKELKHQRKITKLLLEMFISDHRAARRVLLKTEPCQKRHVVPATTQTNKKCLFDNSACKNRVLPFTHYCRDHVYLQHQHLYIRNEITDAVNADIYKPEPMQMIKKARKRTKLLPLTKRYKKKKRKSKMRLQNLTKDVETGIKENKQLKTATIKQERGQADALRKTETPVSVPSGDIKLSHHNEQSNDSSFNISSHEIMLNGVLEEDFDFFGEQNVINHLPTKEETEELERALLLAMPGSPGIPDNLDKVGSWLDDFNFDDRELNEENNLNDKLPMEYDDNVTFKGQVLQDSSPHRHPSENNSADMLSEDSGIQPDMACVKHEPFCNIIDAVESHTLPPPPLVTVSQHYTFGSCLCGLSDSPGNENKANVDLLKSSFSTHDLQSEVKLEKTTLLDELQEIEGVLESLHCESVEGSPLLADSPASMCNLNEKQYTNMLAQQLSQEAETSFSNRKTHEAMNPVVSSTYDFNTSLSSSFNAMYQTSQQNVSPLLVNASHGVQMTENLRTSINGSPAKLCNSSISAAVSPMTVNQNMFARNSEEKVSFSNSQSPQYCAPQNVHTHSAQVVSAQGVQNVFCKSPRQLQHNTLIQSTNVTIAQIQNTTVQNFKPPSSSTQNSAKQDTKQQKVLKPNSTARSVQNSTVPNNTVYQIPNVSNVKTVPIAQSVQAGSTQPTYTSVTGVVSTPTAKKNGISDHPLPKLIQQSPIKSQPMAHQSVLLHMGGNNVIPVVIGTGPHNGAMVKLVIPQNGSSGSQQSMVIIPVNAVVKNGQMNNVDNTNQPFNIAPMNTVKAQLSNLQTGQQFFIVNGNAGDSARKSQTLSQKSVKLPQTLILNPVGTPGRANTLHSKANIQYNGVKPNIRFAKSPRQNRKSSGSKSVSASTKQKLHRTLVENGRQNSLSGLDNSEVLGKNTKQSLKQSKSVPANLDNRKTTKKNKTLKSKIQKLKSAESKAFETVKDNSEPVCRTMNRRSKCGPSLSDDEIISEELGGVDIGDGLTASCVHWNQTTTAGPSLNLSNTTYTADNWRMGQPKNTFQGSRRITPNLTSPNQTTQRVILGNLGSIGTHNTTTKLNCEKSLSPVNKTLSNKPQAMIKTPSISTNNCGTEKLNHGQNETSAPNCETGKSPGLGFVKIGTDSFCSSPINIKMNKLKVKSTSDGLT